MFKKQNYSCINSFKLGVFFQIIVWGFSGARMSGFNWGFFLGRLEENSSAQRQKEGGTRARARRKRAILPLYETAGQDLTKYFHDVVKELKCWDLVLCSKTYMKLTDPILGENLQKLNRPRFQHN